MPEKVIELSVEESNKLRAKLGLKPLVVEGNDEAAGGNKKDKKKNKRKKGKQDGNDGGSDDKKDGKEILEMSVDESNALRAKLGLKPLESSGGGASSKANSKEVHRPAGNDGKDKEASDRIERARLKRQVEAGISSTFGTSTLASGDDNALSWAAQMRKKSKKQSKSASKKSKKSPKPASGDPGERGSVKPPSSTSASGYQEQDLAGIQVGHNVADLEAGTTTVMTLKDDSVLGDGGDDDGPTLENIGLKQSKTQKRGLALKRQLELGMGRAGGYAGFDDDEFEELGGTLGPSRSARGAEASHGPDGQKGDKSRGFVIGDKTKAEERANMTDFDAIQQGHSVSLVAGQSDVAATDYMTVEEEEAERQMRRKKKDGAFKKQKKKDKKKLKKAKKKQRKKGNDVNDSDDDDDEEAISAMRRALSAKSNKKKSIADELDETAVDDGNDRRKRRRTDDETPMEIESSSSKTDRFHEIMEKGNDRTNTAFQGSKNVVDDDEEPDDSFLNAALAKARRLNRLKNMSAKKSTGADAVAEAVKSSGPDLVPSGAPTSGESSNGISFSTDDTREFTRALQARTAQASRKPTRKTGGIVMNIKSKEAEKQPSATDENAKSKEADAAAKAGKDNNEDGGDDDDDNMDIDELAKQVKDDPEPGEGLGNESGVGRGLSSFVSMLKSTGELNKKRSTGEELRGRANDERNYDNYKPLDLNKVVKIGANATEKDREFANREIKLEYRDKHGRLLTQKESYRELCYQFHGHGASKKNEDKRLRRIAMEQSEARVASRSMSAARDGNGVGTLGALKATQKATGKAFLVHKT